MPLRPQLHSKTLGMLTAQFVIAPLEEDVKLRVGIFATPLKSYNCTVRVSSSNPFPQADTVPDLRGIAIKLADFNQDFVLLNVPTLPFGKPSAFSRQGKKDVSAVNLEMRKSGYAKALLEMTPARLNPSCPFDQQYGQLRFLNMVLIECASTRWCRPRRTVPQFQNKWENHISPRQFKAIWSSILRVLILWLNLEMNSSRSKRLESFWAFSFLLRRHM